MPNHAKVFKGKLLLKLCTKLWSLFSLWSSDFSKSSDFLVEKYEDAKRMELMLISFLLLFILCKIVLGFSEAWMKWMNGKKSMNKIKCKQKLRFCSPLSKILSFLSNLKSVNPYYWELRKKQNKIKNWENWRKFLKTEEVLTRKKNWET